MRGVTSSALYEDDDDPMVDEDGWLAMTPDFAEFEMLSTLEDPPHDEPQAQLSPQEAYDAMKFSAPLSEAEAYLLDSVPFLEPGPEQAYPSKLHIVADADHDEWLFKRAQARKRGMDEVLEDTMYGSQLTPEEIAAIKLDNFERFVAREAEKDRRAALALAARYRARALAQRQQARDRRALAAIQGRLEGLAAVQGVIAGISDLEARAKRRRLEAAIAGWGRW